MYSENCAVERECNVYIDIINDCEKSLSQINSKISFISSSGLKNSQGASPTRNELEGRLVGLLNTINDIRDNIVK